MFQKGRAAAGATDDSQLNLLDQDSRKAMLATLIARENAPSQMQWMVIQEACQELLSNEKQLLASLATAKKSSQFGGAESPRASSPLVSGRQALRNGPAVRARKQFAPTVAETIPAPDSKAAVDSSEASGMRTESTSPAPRVVETKPAVARSRAPSVASTPSESASNESSSLSKPPSSEQAGGGWSSNPLVVARALSAKRLGSS